jgi:hypothetical protein
MQVPALFMFPTGLLPHLPAVNARSGGWVIAVLAPRRMIEVNYRVPIPGRDSAIERQVTDLTPVAKRPALTKGRTCGLSCVGNLDIECERPFWNRIATVEDLRHDFVPEVEVVPSDPRLIGMDEQTHERRRPSRRSCKLA